jgi:hypothetical protein
MLPPIGTDFETLPFTQIGHRIPLDVGFELRRDMDLVELALPIPTTLKCDGWFILVLDLYVEEGSGVQKRRKEKALAVPPWYAHNSMLLFKLLLVTQFREEYLRRTAKGQTTFVRSIDFYVNEGSGLQSSGR